MECLAYLLACFQESVYSPILKLDLLKDGAFSRGDVEVLLREPFDGLEATALMKTKYKIIRAHGGGWGCECLGPDGCVLQSSHSRENAPQLDGAPPYISVYIR